MNRQFGALRGLAIILVVLNHSIDCIFNTTTWLPGQASHASADGLMHVILTALQNLGVLAVPMFLFISGSFFAYAASGSRTKLSWTPVRSSLKHVLWPYFIWSIVFYALVYLLRGEQYSVWGYATKLLVGYPFWFVPLLVFWYIASPVLVRFSDRYGWAFIVALGIYQLVLVNLVYDGVYGFQFPSWMHLLVPKVIGVTMAQWAIFFPLGLICGLKAKSVNPKLAKFSWILLSVTIMMLALSILDANAIVRVPLAGLAAATAFVLYMPSIKREAIPLYRQLEQVGRKSYGVYLLELIVLFLALIVIQAFVPGLFDLDVLELSILFIAALAVPLVIMSIVAHSLLRGTYHYLFG
jgi:peptidoglycan/LPS O-acetylase OafA/YrhL